MITFSSSLTTREHLWTDLKSIVSARNLTLQCDESAGRYTVYAYDGPEVHLCTIWLGTVPETVVSSGYAQVQNDADKADFEANHKAFTDRPAGREDADKVRMAGVNFRKADIADTAHFMLIDLDNYGGYGEYRHALDSCLNLAGVHGTFRKSNITDDWGCYIGCVLAIDGSQATIGWLRLGTIGLRDTANLQVVETNFTFPLVMCLDVVDGDYESVLTNFKETTSAINTGMALEDASGNMRVPAVGDLLMKVERFSGSGTATIHYFLWYCTE